MQRVADGDENAYRTLCERHVDSIMNYAYRMLRQRTDAEDVVQETFLRLWTSAATWTPRARPSAWLHRIAHNLCIDRLRKPRMAGDGELARIETEDRPNRLLLRKEVAEQVDDALQELPERQRAAIVLVHYQGMAQDEAAQVLGMSVDALESALARARRTLRERLAGHAEQLDSGGEP
jgi:RNA polymerase sigma-70 factor (ECF subfamily)